MAEEKTYPSLDEDEFKKAIADIVDQLHIAAATRDAVTEIIKEINTKYGIKKPVVRAVAATVFKRDIEEQEEKNEEVSDLVRIAT
jgi:hypothetical protein